VYDDAGLTNRLMDPVWRLNCPKLYSTSVARQMRRAVVAYCFTIILGLFSACGATLGSVDERARGFNEETADYVNVASLLNIVRASHNEPLNFVALVGNTGHDTFGGALGLPNVSFFVGPNKPQADRLFGFVTTGSSVSGSVSNDFQFSVIDDPTSAAALLRPLDPAALAFFINQGYDRELLFLLFVQQIDIFDSSFHAPQKQPPQNEPFPLGRTHDTPDFQISPDFQAAYEALRRYIRRERLITGNGAAPPNVSFADVGCYPGPKRPSSGKSANVQKINLPNLTVTYQVSGIDNPSTSAATTHILSCFSPSAEDKEHGVTKTYPVDAWTFCDPDNNIVILRTRSLQGAYRFLGQLLLVDDWQLQTGPNIPNSPLFLSGHEKENMLYVTHDQDNCFTKLDYNGKIWCVPAEAVTTKRVFALLHQLFKLFTQPSNQPITPTVRLTG
jgi:hypothetical protein